jgi:outer membrane protein with beta-barrel domain
MKIRIVLAALASLGGIAAAQPTEPGSGTTDVSPTPPPQPEPPPRPEPPPPQPPPPAHEIVMEPAHASDGIHPTDLAFAIGIGYARPAGGSFDLQKPNVASVRLRLINGITLEPIVAIANTSADNTMAMMTTTDTTTELDLGSLVRFPVIRHGRYDFEVLGSLGFDVVKKNPNGDYNTITTTTFALGWGIGIGYWFSPHWQLSASATNPLLTYTGVKTETGPDDATANKTSSTTFAVQFDPEVLVMLHLYN